MRWETPVDKEERIVKRFLIFPTSIQGETRWWETAYIRQYYNSSLGDSYWCNKEWIDPESVTKFKETLSSHIQKMTNNLINTIRIETESKIHE